MRDGRTVKRRAPGAGAARQGIEEWCATLVVIDGAAAGSEHRLAAPRTLLGRGPAVDLAFEDDQMSQQHAALEFADGGLRISDLGSTNGTRVNGEPVVAQPLESGDRIAFGRHVFQIVLEKRDVAPRTWVLPEADTDP